MDIRRWNSINIVFVLAGILNLAAQTTLITTAIAADSIDVQCYIRDGDDYVPLSNVDVYDDSKAALTCNAVYMDCKGQCIGCYLDDNEDEYCYDNAGRKFRK